MNEKVLKAIAEADAEECLVYLKAAIRRREELLDGGEVICREYSKEEVLKRDKCYEMMRIRYEAGFDGEYEAWSSEEIPQCRIL